MKIITKNLSNDNAKLTCYIHDVSAEMPTIERRPAVLVFPGGAYMMCSDREADPIALSYFAQGFNTFILRYTVGAKEPCQKAFDDANEALHYLRSNDWELRIDSEKIAVIGFSAGGHLAAWLSIFGAEKPNAVILGYPAILAESGKLIGKDFPELIAHVNSDIAPTFIFAARNDDVVSVEHTIKYLDALYKANVCFESHIFSAGGHGFSLARPLTASGSLSYVNNDAAKWFDLSLAWLNNLFGDFEVSDIKPAINVLDTNASLGKVMENEETYKRFCEFFPSLDFMIQKAIDEGKGDMMLGLSLRGIAQVQPHLFEVSQMDALDEELRK